MSARSRLEAAADERELTLTRVFAAPRSVVFAAFTDRRRLAQWWGPRDFTNPVCEIDARPGGAIRIDMRGPDGVVYPMVGEVREIAAPERLVFTSAALDASGAPMFRLLTRLEFAESAGRTTLTLHAHVLDEQPGAAVHLDGMEQGWVQSLERLDVVATRPADRELWIERTFDAPRELVFAAWTDAEHALHWFAPPGCTVTSCSMDLRVGGAWRSCMRWPDGSDHWQGGVFREIVRPDRLVFTYAWEDEKGRAKHDTLVTVRLEECDGRTALTFHQAVFESESSRASHGGGWQGSLDVLAEYLSKPRGARA